MSSVPPPQPQADPHSLSHAAHLQQATKNVNRFAKRDPALYPLSFIVVGALGVAGYFFMSKTTEVEPHKKLVRDGIVHPWDDASKHDTHPSQLAAFKYRYKTRQGHFEDADPAMGAPETFNAKK
ncbi:hypothetical protein BCR39DRAFT_524347 [Naematelia encephala]|uniref:Uncharacterized protein n=1 Tax=Naematelia encephala TaxID=71784 RepID=A0A1Y2BBE2_9TREE|nr:hypothetical protein BCR39DRAFT_524347 [Naematelia encephala]